MTNKPQTDQTDDDLDAFFSAARAEAPVPPSDLVARILVDADAVASAPRRGSNRGWSHLVQSVLDAVGGWPAAAGLAAATLAGVTVGLTAPDLLDTVSGGILAAESTADFLPSYAALLEDG